MYALHHNSGTQIVINAKPADAKFTASADVIIFGLIVQSERTTFFTRLPIIVFITSKTILDCFLDFVHDNIAVGMGHNKSFA